MAATLTETEVEIEEDVITRLLANTEEAGQVIVHCRIKAAEADTYARIWNSTYLLDNHSDHKSELLYSEGIVRHPFWQLIPMGTTLYFTLVFSALPRTCTSFDFREIIPEPGGFHVERIPRNSTDVYSIDLTEA